MKRMTKFILTITLLVSSIASAAPWMPWDNNSNNNGGDNLMESWMPWGGNSNSNFNPFSGGNNFGPMDGMTNWGPFNSGSDFGPMDGMTNWGPMNSDANWGPVSTVNNWVNDTDVSLYFKTNNKTEGTGYARADGKYAGELQNRMSGQGKSYATGNADQYYKGQTNNYGEVRGKGCCDAKLTLVKLSSSNITRVLVVLIRGR